ncbi:hypothetical protein [Photobacterium carnosum]|uniref:hypothetical protein n=1 Tax=Photobacterium carnosum TaxID=2023717 RepID=UPI001E3F5B49|nr:hypothetical protein [Photobacterium carnosum]MCF2152983.1 hypothetical protein [Photobacterium carnosum]MCF2214743.1 hypothetical protein [Photobacterium carnosum]
MNIETLKLYKSIRESMTEITVEGAFVCGFINFNENMINKLKLLAEAELCSAAFKIYKDSVCKTELTVNDEITPKHYSICNLAKIELNRQSKQSSDYFICSSWDDLTEYKDYLLNPVRAVYFSDDNKIITTNSGDKKFTTYLNLSKICNLVKDVSLTSKGNTYTILCGQTLDITISLDKSILDSDIDISFLDELLNKDQHKEAMNSLIREALYNLLSNLDCKSRLSYLVRHFNAFTSKLLVSYAQYVRNYSFDKVRKEYREKATEYIGKINKVFDDVATKTFAIPLGVWFATSKIEVTTSIESLQFLKNISYCFMVVFLVLIVLINLLGQFSTLSATKGEYSDLFERLESELEISQKPELTILKKKLDTRNAVVFFKLIVTIIFALILMGFTIFVAYKALSIPI